MNKTFVCLASSRKHSGLCMAGKELGSTGSWIRPVSKRDSSEISKTECQYSDGAFAQVLDIITVSFREKKHHNVQEENYLIDDEYYWAKQGEYSGDLEHLLDKPHSLWLNGYSSYNGTNDRVPENYVTSPMQSLYFIQPEYLSFIITIEGASFGNPKKKVRARFRYNGIWYKVTVTDPCIEQEYLQKDTGIYNITGKIYMTISLGEVYGGYYYKLAASIYRKS